MIRFAIIGLGNIGTRHATHIIDNPAASLVAIADIDSSKQAVANQYQVPFYTDVTTFLSEIHADVICICTPNHLHKSHSILAMEHGFHVVIEKPMALSSDECDAMMHTAKVTSKTIFAVKQNRYNPPVQVVHELIQNHKIGDILWVQVNCFWNRNDAYYASSDWRGKKDQDGGCLFTQFSHFVDILYYLIGDITPMQGYIQNYLHQHNTEFEDTGTFSLTSSSGAMINFNFTTCSYEKNMEGSITIMGSKGAVKIGGQYLNTIEYSRVENTELPIIDIQAKENDYGAYKGSMSNHDKVIQNVIDVLQHNQPIMTTAEAGKAVVQIIEGMYASATKL